jgi:hypothetical protein
MAQSWALVVIPIRNALGDCVDKVQTSNCVIELMADGRSDQFKWLIINHHHRSGASRVACSTIDDGLDRQVIQLTCNLQLATCQPSTNSATTSSAFQLVLQPTSGQW